MNYFNTYKKRFYLLIASGLLFSLLSYKFAIKNTISTLKEVKTLSKKIGLADNAPYKIHSLRDRANKLNLLLGTNDSKNEHTHVELLEMSSAYSSNNSIVISKYLQEHSYAESDYALKTNIITIKGRFVEVLKFLFLLEKQKSLGKIISTNYFVQKDIYSGKKSLLMTLYIQNISTNDYEK